MHAPSGDDGDDGVGADDVGVGNDIDQRDVMATDGGSPPDGGATTGVGGMGAGGMTGGATGTDGGEAGAAPVDAGQPDVPRVCSARFNFEGGSLYGATINTGFQTGFSDLADGSDAACGSGALRVNVSVTPAAPKGELIIPLGGAQDVSGETFSIATKTAPAPTPNANVLVFLVPSYAFVTAFAPIPATWTTHTVTLPSGADAGTLGATGIAIQFQGRGDTYSGVLSVDEVDLR